MISQVERDLEFRVGSELEAMAWLRDTAQSQQIAGPLGKADRDGNENSGISASRLSSYSLLRNAPFFRRSLSST